MRKSPAQLVSTFEVLSLKHLLWEHRLCWRRLARRPRRPRKARTVPQAPSGPSVSGYGEPHRYVLYLLYWAVPGATDIRDTEIHICQLGRRSIGVAVSHGGCDAPVPAVPLPIRSRDRGTTESSVIDTAPRGEGRGSICRGGRVRVESHMPAAAVPNCDGNFTVFVCSR